MAQGGRVVRRGEKGRDMADDLHGTGRQSGEERGKREGHVGRPAWHREAEW